MKIFFYLSVIIILFCAVNSFGQVSGDMKAVIDKIVSHAETVSLYKENVNWDPVKNGMYERAKNAKDISGLTPTFNYFLAQLKDQHARIFYKNQVIANWYGETKPYQKTIDPQMWGTIQSGKYKFQARLLKNNIGYIRIVGMPMGDNLKMSKEIRDAVCQLKAKRANSWIVDLRYNGGGNMYPMLEGIANIIGDGIIGGSKDATGNTSSTWKIEDADFYYDKELSADLPNDCKFKSSSKVAVLISQYTSSSGEVVAVAFKGRPKTRFFGGGTSGFTTVTDWTPLADDLFMAISTSYYIDRTGKIYKENIEVDESAKFVPSEEVENDEAIEKATQWLTGKKN